MPGATVLPGISHKRARPCRPQTNGKVERLNRTLLDEWAYARRHIHLGHPRRPDVSRTAAR
ncbi:hypothetical protein BOG92_015550 [Streptomyces sp. WAC00263]|nr:hypothetical protein BOG92_015550 [Streptomyces sp. WAC00263]